MKQKILALILLFLYAIGTVNGIGYSLWIGEYVTAMAFPVAKKCWQELND